MKFGNQSKTYAVCLSCNTLYNTADVIAKEGFKYTHIEFPIKLKEKSYGMELTVQVPLVNENIRCPKLIFLLSSLKI